MRLDYTYRATIVSVYDGDTVRADIDLGFGIVKKNEKLRLMGIDAPEIRGDDREHGIASRDRLRELILNKSVIIRTKKDRRGKWGRYIADVFFDMNGEFLSVCNVLISEGLAVKYE